MTGLSRAVSDVVDVTMSTDVTKLAATDMATRSVDAGSMRAEMRAFCTFVDICLTAIASPSSITGASYRDTITGAFTMTGTGYRITEGFGFTPISSVAIDAITNSIVY